MAEIHDGKEHSRISMAFMLIAAGVMAVAMMNNRDEEMNDPSPPAQVDVQKDTTAVRQNPEANHPVPDTIRLP